MRSSRPLSPREREVAVLISGGLTNREIAKALGTPNAPPIPM
ncbi:LuxR C-terminal-related transcriptional regulator [Rubrobacter indicoceani]|nr:LuxR C-terminal-related transcriptional regulator [Rubrobacter indicoceani]